MEFWDLITLNAQFTHLLYFFHLFHVFGSPFTTPRKKHSLFKRIPLIFIQFLLYYIIWNVNNSSWFERIVLSWKGFLSNQDHVYSNAHASYIALLNYVNVNFFWVMYQIAFQLNHFIEKYPFYKGEWQQ